MKIKVRMVIEENDGTETVLSDIDGTDQWLKSFRLELIKNGANLDDEEKQMLVDDDKCLQYVKEHKEDFVMAGF